MAAFSYSDLSGNTLVNTSVTTPGVVTNSQINGLSAEFVYGWSLGATTGASVPSGTEYYLELVFHEGSGTDQTVTQKLSATPSASTAIMLTGHYVPTDPFANVVVTAATLIYR